MIYKILKRKLRDGNIESELSAGDFAKLVKISDSKIIMDKLIPIAGERIIDYVNPSFKNDLESFKILVQRYGTNLKYASEKLRDDDDLVRMAIETNGVAIRYASEDLKYKFASLAVFRHGLALEYIPEILRKDREIILLAVKSDGLAMRFANYIEDREICMTAVINNGMSLPFIHCDFAESDEYITEAITSVCYAIKYVHYTYQTLAMAKIVVRKDATTLQYLRKDLWDHPEVRQVALNPEEGREYAEEFYLNKLINFNENNSDIDTDSSSEF